MAVPLPGQATTVPGAIAAMEQIAASLPARDGVACFNDMYLSVTRDVGSRLGAGFFADPAFTSQLDVAFANLYFDAVNAAGDLSSVPLAWRPLVQARGHPGIEPVQFALAGMNAHINHDLPLAVVATCAALGTSPDAGAHHDDYQKVDTLLDAAEQSVRQSLETQAERELDQHLSAVCNLVGCWTINSARDLAWSNSLLLWELRDVPFARQLFCATLAASVATASEMLLVAL